MKSLFFIFIVALIAYCRYEHPFNQKQTEDIPETPPGPKSVLNIIVNDVSQSGHWLDLTSKDVFDLLNADSNQNSTVQLAGILINEQGATQRAFLSPAITLNIRPVVGDIYKQTETERQNTLQRAEFNKRCSEITADFASKILLPRTALLSDVNGALETALRLSSLDIYASFREIRLIILSDLLHDTGGNEKTKPFRFPKNVVVFLIGSHPSADLNALFPDNKKVALPHFEASFFTLNTLLQ